MLEAVQPTGPRLSPARALPPSLDDPACWPGFGTLEPASRAADQPRCWTSQFAIEGVYCAGCALLIEAAVRSVPGVAGVQVNSGATRAEVRWDAAVTRPSAIVHAIARAGYQARPGQHPSLLALRRAEQRKLLWRWLVAGLCMMQVMMYATPAYVADAGAITPDELMLLHWASWVLTLPVMFFSCAPFFASAAAEWRARRIGMGLPVALGMAIAFVVSTAATFSPGGLLGREVYFDSLTMFVFFLLSVRWLEGRLKSRTAGALEALAERLPDTAQRMRPTTDHPAVGLPEPVFERVALSQVAPGDILKTDVGEAFAADGHIVQGQTLVDETLLTGESTPLPRGPGSGTGQVIAGSMNRGASVLMRVERVGQATRMAEIVALMASAATRKPKLAVLADRIAAPFMACVVVTAFGSLAWWWGQGDPARALMVCVAVLIVTCPCALSLATPAAMLAAAGSLARAGVLVRRLDAIEALARCDTVVLDKTGTLTDDTLHVERVIVREGFDPAWAVACAVVLAKESTHPVSRAVAALTPAEPGCDTPPDNLPIRTSVRETPGQGLRALCADGRSMSLGSWPRGGDARAASPVPAQDAAEPSQPQCHLADDSGWLASFMLSEALRPQARDAVAGLRAQGCHVMLLSGDRPQAVERVARQLGLADFAGGCSPEDKLERVRSMQAAGHRVAMVGDGLNDGPVLSAADASFAVGTGAPLACGRSDFVILGAQLGALAPSLALSRRALRVVRQNLAWAAFYNAACIPLAMAGWLPAWAAGLGMAASSLVVVAHSARLARAVR